MQAEELCERDRLNMKRFSFWWVIWVCAFGVATVLLPSSKLPVILSWTLAALPLVLGFFAVRSYVYFLKQADELIQKIHLEALALGCGSGLIVGTALGLLAQVVGHNEDAGAFIWLSILAGYVFGLTRAQRRYRV